VGGAVRAVGGGGNPGMAVQVDPMKPKLKPLGTKCLKVNCDILLPTSAFKYNLRRYTQEKTRAEARQPYCCLPRHPTLFSRMARPKP
jgi:hypothetical protein